MFYKDNGISIPGYKIESSIGQTTKILDIRNKSYTFMCWFKTREGNPDESVEPPENIVHK